MDYESFRVDTLPPTLYYIPEFLAPSEETRLLECIERTPKVKWTQLSNRRLQNWGGVPHPKVLLAAVVGMIYRTVTAIVSVVPF